MAVLTAVEIGMSLPGRILCGIALLASSSGCLADLTFNIAVVEDGLYRVSFEDLGYTGEPLISREMGLYEQGNSVALQVDDGGDGIFGSDDSFSFVGRHLEGSHSWYDEYSRFNIYQLRLGSDQEARPVSVISAKPDAAIVHHIERNTMRVALAAAENPQAAERWYWHRLSHLDKQPFSVDLGPTPRPQAIRLGMAGLSRDMRAESAGLSQHEVQLMVNGQVIGTGRWHGQEAFTLHVANLNTVPWDEGGTTLELVAPLRKLPESDQPLIDVVLLDWIEIEYAAGTGFTGNTIVARQGDHLLVVPDGYQSPAWVKRSAPDDTLATASRQADYLMLTHASLIDAIGPLADYHRSTGLEVAIIDVQAIYDQFNHGIQSPFAIQAFISYAWHHWRRPAPRFVLLAGDAAWSLDEDRTGNRNLVPTLQVQANDELAASDNGLVAVAGVDWHPDLAVGRLPAGNAEEMRGMVRKLLSWAQDPPEGDWGHHTIWIADSNPGFQQISTDLANSLHPAGFSADRIFAEATAGDGTQDQERIIEAFNEGSLLVHFLGHGGRFVWRTGEPDLTSATDLFEMKDIDALAPNRKLPLVLSMTCSSGPFDHPEADSIAERFLRVPDRGAVAVLAASWRVPGSREFSTALVRELFIPGNPIGEAIMKAKQQESNRTLVESYNLLGDPALSLLPYEEDSP